MSKEKLIEYRNVKQYFPVAKNKYVKAVDNLSLDIFKGEVLGLVGESGSGKSTIAYTTMGMYHRTDGNIIFNGEKLSWKKNQRPKSFYSQAQIVFQDPASSLNPHHDIKQILSLPLKVQYNFTQNQIEQKILEILELVELPADFLYKSPNSLGGGEKQLISIARALCCEPQFIILDEPTSSLDVSIQAKILNMLMRIKEQNNLTYLFITHDMAVMRNVSTRIAIMYLGKICEIAPTETFYENPQHPYTQMLISSIPVVSKEEEQIKPARMEVTGEVPSPVNIPIGCSFNTRCPYKMDICLKDDPVIKQISSNHYVRCHLFS